MNHDISVVIGELVGAAGRVDTDQLSAAVSAQLERLLGGHLPRPLEQPSDAGTIRLSSELATDRLADPSRLAGELAWAIATSLGVTEPT
jgi:hypothetical protein